MGKFGNAGNDGGPFFAILVVRLSRLRHCIWHRPPSCSRGGGAWGGLSAAREEKDGRKMPKGWSGLDSILKLTHQRCCVAFTTFAPTHT